VDSTRRAANLRPERRSGRRDAPHGEGRRSEFRRRTCAVGPPPEGEIAFDLPRRGPRPSSSGRRRTSRRVPRCNRDSRRRLDAAWRGQGPGGRRRSRRRRRREILWAKGVPGSSRDGTLEGGTEAVRVARALGGGRTHTAEKSQIRFGSELSLLVANVSLA